MTEKEVGYEYGKMSVELADIIARVSMMQEQCERMSNEMEDDGAPSYNLAVAVRHLGQSLASIVTYAHEYTNPKEDKADE